MPMTTKRFSSLLLSGFVASVAPHQTSAAGPRWNAFAGGWEPVVAEGASPATTAPVCVVPSRGAGVDLITVVDKKVTERTHVDADGALHDVKQQDSARWESASSPADGRRVY